MELFEALVKRRSIRSYGHQPVDERDLRKILGAAILAPSAGNLQPWEFIVVKDTTRKAGLAEAALDQQFIADAPVVIVVCANEERSASRYGNRGRRLYCLQDTAAAVENMLLATTALGYGACWIGAFNEDKARGVLRIPFGVRPIALIPLGMAAEKPGARQRRSAEGVVHYETYGGVRP